MINEENCPVCNGDHKTIAVRGIRGCTFPVEYRDFVRDLQRRAEIGARAVELLREASISAMMPKKYRPRIRTLVADARAAGMVVS